MLIKNIIVNFNFSSFNDSIESLNLVCTIFLFTIYFFNHSAFNWSKHQENLFFKTTLNMSWNHSLNDGKVSQQHLNQSRPSKRDIFKGLLH